MRRTRSIVFTLPIVALFACGGGEDAAVEAEPEVAAEPPAPAATVRIVEPQEGATVGPNVTVVLETEGIEILPISPPVPGTGHHHLYVDVDLTPLAEMIPQGNDMIIHKGDGTSEHTIEGLAPGPHRIIALVANPAHIPIDPPVADTVNFTVGN